jgi:hypothetical protein
LKEILSLALETSHSLLLNPHGMALMVPIPNPWSAISFPTHEKYLYGIPHHISIDLETSTSLPREFAIASLIHNSHSESIG